MNVPAANYLQPSRLIESDDPAIIAFARQTTDGASDDIRRAVCLYRAVRDQIAYDPYDRLTEPESCSARRALTRQRGFCIPKAALLVASARALGIAARIGFADVRNHLASPRLIKANNGDVFRWHSYAELFLASNWIKATPAFDLSLCRHAGILPLEFDGRHDSMFHAYDQRQRRHMEYVLDRGHFAGVPFEAVLSTWREQCPAVLDDSYLAGARSFIEEVDKPAG